MFSKEVKVYTRCWRDTGVSIMCLSLHGLSSLWASWAPHPLSHTWCGSFIAVYIPCTQFGQEKKYEKGPTKRLVKEISSDYCKRWYFRGINFLRLAAQKHIRGLLNSRWAHAHLSFLYCTINIMQWMIHIYKYLCNWAAQKQADLRQTWVYYPFASTHMVNTQLLRVQNVHTNIANIFAGFWIRACWKTAKSAKINVPRIFPRLK